MNENFRNASGYYDPTAGKAISSVQRQENEAKEQRRISLIKSRKKIYVVSAYRGNVDFNTLMAQKYCRYVTTQGFIPIASHLLFTQFLDDRIPEERETGCLYGLALLAMCNEVWVFNKHRELSDGMRAEIKEARLLNKKVCYFDTEALKL